MQTVRIMNPAHGEGWTSFNRAQEYVDQGRACWLKPKSCAREDGKPKLAIRFLENHPLDVKVRATRPAQNWDGYDRRRIPLTLEEQCNVPLVQTQRRVHQRPLNDARGRRWPRQRDGSLRIVEP